MFENQSAGSAASPPAPPLYADVIVPRHLTGFFTYLVPEQFRPALKIGQCVIVPFGGSRVQGAVVRVTHFLPPGLKAGQLKPIASIITDNGLAEIPAQSFDLARRVADYYVAPLGQCLRLVMPRSSVLHRQEQRLILTDLGRSVLSQPGLPEETVSLLKRLARRPAGVRRSTLFFRSPSKQLALIDGLLNKRWIDESRPVPDFHKHQVVERDNEGLVTGQRVTDGLIPSEWKERLAVAVKSRQGTRLVLQAPWASRVSLLVHAIRETLADRRTALVIVGEGDRARWLAEELNRFGVAVSACVHQNLSDRARAIIWKHARLATPQVVVGTRSATFLPFPSLGMIWIEGIEDQALKEPKEPRYHAEIVAWFRAKDEGAVLVLSSAHPCLEADLGKTGASERLHEEAPIHLRPRIEAVDLRSLNKKTVLSPLLTEAIREAMDRKERAVLFLNRKGYATALVCQDCGQVPRCDRCRVAFAYHRHNGCLSCSYCGAMAPLPHVCPSCGGHRLKLIGEGTERVEDEAKRLFPQARVLRADGETMRKRTQAMLLWKSIQDKQWDILVGTQAMLRDYAVPTVALVGVVQADTSLNLPDFRAAERTYHLLCDAAALARPAHEGGRVVIQSYLPSHHAIQAVVQQDPSVFTVEELSQRMALRYPPAIHLIALQVSGAKEKQVQVAAERWVRQLQMRLLRSSMNRPASRSWSLGESDEFAVLGPIPSRLPKQHGRYRRVILLKSAIQERGRQAVRDSICELEKAYRGHALKFEVDVDPVEIC